MESDGQDHRRRQVEWAEGVRPHNGLGFGQGISVTVRNAAVKVLAIPWRGCYYEAFAV